MDMIKIAAICIISAVICGILGAQGREYALYIKIAAVCMIMSAVVVYISPVIDGINSIFLRADIDDKYITVLFKAVGICYISQFACDICKDSGENALATQAELAGKAALIVLAMPLVEELTGIVVSLSGY
ncbi:MAG: SpoIIIAC/SpoIIIAD family protein [Oscillospiraceae bacterium]